MCAPGNRVSPQPNFESTFEIKSSVADFATTQNAGTIAPAGEALFRDPRERADRDHATGRGGLILADAYAAEIFAQGEPDGVRHPDPPRDAGPLTMRRCIAFTA